MKLLRLFRQYDSIKAAIMLFALAVFLAGSCIRAACAYAAILRAPAEYVCTAPDGFQTILPKLADHESVRGYSLQKKVTLTQENRTMTAACLSAAYLSDCLGIEASSRSIFANAPAYTAFCGTDAAQQEFRGQRDGKPFFAEIIRTDALPSGRPFAAMAAGAAELHDAEELRVCLTGADQANALAQLGLQIADPEAQTVSEYEQKLVLLRIRLGALAACLSCIAAAAFLRIFRDSVRA